MADGDRLVGIDLGGTNIYAVLVDGDDVVAETKRPTPTDGVDAVIGALADVARELAGDGPMHGVGVGTPGVVVPRTGELLIAPNIRGFDRPVPLGESLAAALDVPVVVANDANAAAYGEARAGAGAGHDDALALWLGTGVGGGLILDGRLRTGGRGLAGEIGHTVVVPGGRRCGCGGAGHLEAYAGRRMLEAHIREQAAAGAGTSILDGDPARLKSKAWRRAYDAGDDLVVAALDEAFGLLALAIANVTLTVEVDVVVLGGGLGERFDDVLVPRLESDLDDVLLAGTPPAIVTAALGDRSGALGAALLAAAE